MKFKSFKSIEPLESQIVITEKIHGSNAQIAIDDDGKTMYVGSRTKWITPQSDNYGFARWARENEAALIALLGPGRHFGEWYGAGIGLGYGLKEKRLALFNTHRWYADRHNLPSRIDVVPILYQGLYIGGVVEQTMEALKQSGSILVPGYMKPEGVVIYFARGQSHYKKVFDKEEMAWDRRKSTQAPSKELDPSLAIWLQPIRLEKLMLRDERYLKEYPKSLKEIAKAYIADLGAERVIDTETLFKITPYVFKMIKEIYGK